MNLANKRVLVVGLGESGVAASNLLVAKGARVSVTDCRDNPKIRANIQHLNKKNIVKIEVGGHTKDLIKGQDLVVSSPGVPADSPALSWTREKGIPLIGEVELAFNFCPAPIIAVTGTNGKTTVTHLLGEIFKAAKRRHVVCGNIGNPFSSEVLRICAEYIVVLEVSSFQLETIVKFRPQVAVILNLSNDHLDRYADFNQYVQAKCNIFSNQTKQDWTILNDDDPNCLSLAAKTKAKVLYFSQADLTDLGNHFNSNHVAALTASSLFALPRDITLSALRHFSGLKHRLEKVTELKGVEFINDSKATNVDSTLWALKYIKKPIILIAGGRDKGSDWAAVKESVGDKVKAMVLLGEAKEKICRVFRDSIKIEVAADLTQAVSRAFALAQFGDCILLSPMCASFDMFADYAERGRVFKAAVDNLSKKICYA